MSELSHIDPRSVALLVMDYQVDPLTRFMTAAQSADAIACVPDLSRKPRSWRAMTLRTASSASVNEAAIIWPERQVKAIRAWAARWVVLIRALSGKW